ncbi:hypothetical protein Dsin_019298 [Dipteronia sinensis]|uniref:Reverse transcriptase zinc-binding domain-containing protein n=1 Tax=Dipteronia sinensis TaxID=43782 RepID=A0AAE0A7G5_9ROSI|nr:hypothetical protein Dsin_019298 [Dipteronia sinensis]
MDSLPKLVQVGHLQPRFVSNPSMMCKWWNSLWKLNIPPKVRIFIWRACLNTIPSLENLWKRKITDVPRCNRCDSLAESASHAIFGCKEARKIWSWGGNQGLQRESVCYSFKLVSGSFSTEVGQFIALRDGLMLATFYNFPVSIAEISSSKVASSFSYSNLSLGDVNFIINVIKALFSEVAICKCQATPKSGNSLAYNLASSAFSSV